MRKFITTLLSLILSVAWPLVITLTAINQTLLQPNFYEHTLQSANAYEGFLDQLALENSWLFDKISATDTDTTLVSNYQSAIANIPASWVETQSSTLIHSALQLISAPGTEIKDLDQTIYLGEIKDAVIPLLLSFPGIEQLLPAEYINTVLPDEIPVNTLLANLINQEQLSIEQLTVNTDTLLQSDRVVIVNDQAAVIQKAIQTLRIIIIISWIVLALCILFIAALFKGWGSRIRGIGFTFLAPAISSALYGVGLWFGGSAYLQSTILSNTSLKEGWYTLASNIIQAATHSFALYIIIPSSIVLIISILLIIIGYVLIARQHRQSNHT